MSHKARHSKTDLVVIASGNPLPAYIAVAVHQPYRLLVLYTDETEAVWRRLSDPNAVLGPKRSPSVAVKKVCGSKVPRHNDCASPADPREVIRHVICGWRREAVKNGRGMLLDYTGGTKWMSVAAAQSFKPHERTSIAAGRLAFDEGSEFELTDSHFPNVHSIARLYGKKLEGPEPPPHMMRASDNPSQLAAQASLPHGTGFARHGSVKDMWAALRDGCARTWAAGIRQNFGQPGSHDGLCRMSSRYPFRIMPHNERDESLEEKSWEEWCGRGRQRVPSAKETLTVTAQHFRRIAALRQQSPQGPAGMLAVDELKCLATLAEHAASRFDSNPKDPVVVAAVWAVVQGSALVCGGWLEQLFTHVLSDLAPVANARLVDHTAAAGIAHAPELDVVLAVKSSVRVASCTTSTNSEILEDKLTEAIYRSQQLGGGLAQAALVTTAKQQKVTRAEDAVLGHSRLQRSRPAVFGADSVRYWVTQGSADDTLCRWAGK